MRSLAFIFITLAFQISYAGFSAQVMPILIDKTNLNSVKVSMLEGTELQDVCDYKGKVFKFDGNTLSGQKILNIIEKAVKSNKKIDVWYAPSFASNSLDCNGSTMAQLFKVHIH